MLLRDSPGPHTRQLIPERFGFTYTVKRITQRGFHQLQNSKRGVSVCFNPKGEVLAKLWMENRISLSGRLQIPNSRFIPSTDSGLPWPFSALRKAATSRWAF